MKQNVVWVLLQLSASFLCAQQNAVEVFRSGADGYRSYRIPAIVNLPNGELLAFAEGRVNGSGDFGNIDIVMKRSIDKGKTWSALQVVAENDTLQAGNQAPVVDRTDPRFPSGKIFLFYNTGNNHEGEVRKGNGLREVWCKTSTDGGHRWSNPINITAQVHRPNQPQVNPAYNFPEDWRSYALTPGHAMQFLSGKYKGRIFVAANHSEGDPKPDAKDYRAHGFFTDDHGNSFQLGENVEVNGGNEAMAAELSGDRLVMNIRNQSGDVRKRLVATSSNGGQSWDSVYFHDQLPDPVCQGSILTVGPKKGRSILAFCNAADTQYRDNLTLRISFDEGKSWKIKYVVDRSATGDQHGYIAYSDLVKISAKEIGVLYERNEYAEIVFKAIKWK